VEGQKPVGTGRIRKQNSQASNIGDGQVLCKGALVREKKNERSDPQHLMFLFATFREESTGLLFPRGCGRIRGDGRGARVSTHGALHLVHLGSEVGLCKDVTDVVEGRLVDANGRVPVRVLPLAVDDELELVGPGRHGRDDGPHAAALVEHLDGLPVVPIAGELDIIFRAVGVHKLGLDAVETSAQDKGDATETTCGGGGGWWEDVVKARFVKRNNTCVFRMK
jgi:hypothetical protein